MRAAPTEIISFIGRSSRRIAVTIVGAAFVVAGLAMLALPGPGILVIALGFAILGTEYAWAAAALERTKRTAAHAGTMVRDGASRTARVLRRKQEARGESSPAAESRRRGGLRWPGRR